ncbi:glycosyltransferase [Vibrio hepatarius]|uniref:glycosyltransferase n=1 Tax=Vibrio hepatarius TaxID=171383 RepID=UPI001C09CD59|nr:glycosyltransferase [Vibrio hepatarius]MBU2896883.1 glycosyltransferase [Vibrio hepatarius]
MNSTKNKIEVYSFSDRRGGAAIAATRQVRTLNFAEEIQVIVAEKKSNNKLVLGPTRLQFAFHYILRIFEYALLTVFCRNGVGKKSLNLFSSRHVKKHILKSQACIIHMHWINNDTISISLIKKILKDNDNRKVIITMHDDWLFSNYEHCVLEEIQPERYNFFEAFFYRRKLQLNALLRKSNVIVTAPSLYLKNKANASEIFSKVHIDVVGNAIDTNVFKPFKKCDVRVCFQLEDVDFVILYGASGGKSYLKGYDLLKSALQRVNKKARKAVLLSFGGDKSGVSVTCGFKHIELGKIYEVDMLAKVYSSADVTVVPSRIESFGQVAAESLSCGTPVIAFDNSGLTDIVSDRESGFLVPAFDVAKFASSIELTMALTDDELQKMGKLGRDHILKRYSNDVISKQWHDIYKMTNGN